MSYYTVDELNSIGFKSIGNNVKISKKASFYNVNNICIGDNTRIDDFCVLSAGTGGINLEKNIHIAVYSSLIGAASITMEDYTCLSSRCSVYSSSDDYSGEYMTNPTVQCHLTNVISQNVIIKRHSLIGSGSIILPGVVINENVAVGALSLVKTDLESGHIYGGNPLKKLKKRSAKCMRLAENIHHG
ncbi:acyltransferase [Vibrio breoganii]|uniref:acyltransferase n=1 Tax=Vibrio breoganii TaxID=553239 RepID=UPI000C83203D|nr:galactoside O-acetyltransferase [Vibrio breoganii]PML40661.1 galactoside O-acetyltransferase [Vibrio breoganii]PMO71031.1 galactoside O-acetyltransferase [Vibrio breoganii]PMO90473.1 galactoside O-acetyltransferase [Vibrio breoganii]